jgi:hypothetical protein
MSHQLSLYPLTQLPRTPDILEYLRRAKIKPLNYSQVTAVQQGPIETPVAFLQRLQDALQKHTNIAPESRNEEIILKDKFLTVNPRYS